MRKLFHASTIFLVAMAGLLPGACTSSPMVPDAGLGHATAGAGNLPAWQARFNRSRPVIAIVGDNRTVELTDFVVPYAVLEQAQVAEVIAVAPEAGPIKSVTDLGKPSFSIEAQATTAEFDRRFPDGADYVIVPMTKARPELLRWIAEQAGKGGTLVSICNGALTVADTHAMDGHRATAHWSSESYRAEHYPAIHWVRNARYVVDGNWVSSAGVSAALPTSIAVVEAIAGHARAQAVAQALGVQDWSPAHDSDAFQPRLGSNIGALLSMRYTNGLLHQDQDFGIAASEDMDELVLALTVDVYSSTGRSKAWLLGTDAERLRGRHGLTLIPEAVAASSLQPLALPAGKAAGALDEALNDVANRYGQRTAYGVALALEYPGYRN